MSDYQIYLMMFIKENAIRCHACARRFKNFTDITESVSVPVGHKHGTIFEASESDVKTLLEESRRNKLNLDGRIGIN